LSDYHTVENLKDRGWTEAMVRNHLGKPDEVRSNERSSLRKPISLYAKERVYEAEKGTAKNDLDKIREGRELAKRALRLKKQKQQGG